MKIKFFILTIILLFARACDFYSTSLWFFDDPTSETNPLYRFLGFGWTGLIIANIIIFGLIIYAFYFYSFKYKAPRETRRHFWHIQAMFLSELQLLQVFQRHFTILVNSIISHFTTHLEKLQADHCMLFMVLFYYHSIISYTDCGVKSIE